MITTNEKETILKSKGYDCRGILTLMNDPIKFSKWKEEDLKRRGDLIHEPVSDEVISKFIDDTFDLVIKNTKSEPLRIEFGHDFKSVEAKIPRRAPIRPSRDFRL